MSNLFNAADYEKIIKRIESVQAAAPRKWGTMSSAQMLAHVSGSLHMALGKQKFQRVFLGYILGGIVKKNLLKENASVIRKNSPTAPALIISDVRDLTKEKAKLLQIVSEFHSGGPSKCSKYPHPFFGTLTPDEWSILMYKHLDHHLRQFGV
ncbi:MAG: DUF1569 domain-containing protein [Ignavibacteria bacterium]|nr:DUF1569 domain-containing protein [Ignavibacteria bacterium]